MSKSKIILIVDDDIDMRSYLRKILENMGHQIIEASNIFDANLLLNDHIPHLIFIDINLDSENGFQFIVDIRKLDPYKRIKIFMISSKSTKKTQEFIDKLGVGFLEKPINNQILVTTMKKTIPLLDWHSTSKLDESIRYLEAECLGTIVKINEANLILQSNVKFTSKQKIIIKSKFMNKLQLERIQLIVGGQSSDVSAAIYNTKVHLIGLNEKDQQNIRKLKN